MRTVDETRSAAPVTITPMVAEIIELALKAGLRPWWQPAYRGSMQLIFNGEGVDATFGGLTVGATTGKFIRAGLTYGNRGATVKYSTLRDLRAAIKGLGPDSRVIVPAESADKDAAVGHLHEGH